MPERTSENFLKRLRDLHALKTYCVLFSIADWSDRIRRSSDAKNQSNANNTCRTPRSEFHDLRGVGSPSPSPIAAVSPNNTELIPYSPSQRGSHRKWMAITCLAFGFQGPQGHTIHVTMEVFQGWPTPTSA